MTRNEILRENAETGGMLAMIPSTVLLDEELPPSAKLLYGVITWRANRNGLCWASNETLGADIGLSEKRVSPLISLLEKRGHIEMKIEMNSKATGGRVRYISPVVKSALGILENEDTVSSEMRIPYPQKRERGILKNEEEKYKEENIKGKAPIAPEEVLEKVDEYCGEDAELRDAVLGLLENRAKVDRKKAVKTERAVNGILAKLERLSCGKRGLKLAMLEKAVMNNWLTVYELKPDELPPASAPPSTAPVYGMVLD